MFEFERPRGGERALLVHINLPQAADQDDLDEFVELVRSAGVEDVELVTGSRRQAAAGSFIGKGKLDEIKARVAALGVDVVLFNHALSPSQAGFCEAQFHQFNRWFANWSKQGGVIAECM